MGPSRGTQPLLLRTGLETIAAAGRACGSDPACRRSRARDLRRERADSRSRSVAQSEKTSSRYVWLSLAPRALVDASRVRRQQHAGGNGPNSTGIADAFAVALVVTSVGMESRRRRVREDGLLLDSLLSHLRFCSALFDYFLI